MFRKCGAEALKVFMVRTRTNLPAIRRAAEIRGSYFINGVSGEQFALPEAIGSLRSVLKIKTTGELITLSAADPLNLANFDARRAHRLGLEEPDFVARRGARRRI